MAVDKEQKTSNRDIDLVKVQIYADRVHATFTTYSSFLLALLAGGVVLSLTIRYSTIPYAEIISFSLFGIFLFFAGLGLKMVYQDYTENLKRVSRLIEEVKKGNEMPRLVEIIFHLGYDEESHIFVRRQRRKPQ
jgi:hypothetical protein